MSRKLSQESFEQRIKDIFGNKYTVISEYQGSRKPITLHCNIHNIDFTVTAECFMRGKNDIRSNCPQCTIDKRIAESKLIDCECAYCHQHFKRSPSRLDRSKSGLMFCCREHKDLAQRLGSGKQFDIMRPPHYQNLEDSTYGTINTYRALAFRNYQHMCSICGWNEDIDILQVHHIDENRENNQVDNLIILCPNCHAKLTSHKYQLIDRNTIQKK